MEELEIEVTFNPQLKEESIQIALDFLERSGEIDDVPAAELLLSEVIDCLMQHGVSSRLLLSNLAITAYQRYETARTMDMREPCEKSGIGQ